jgi:hypothetical protein
MSEKELSTKRRATMNSRSAYEEDEMLRQAIEESKAGTLGKRVRDESEEYVNIRDTAMNVRLTSSAGISMVRSASGPSQALRRRCRNKVARHHSRLLTNPPRSRIPMTMQVPKRFVVLLPAITETRRYETVTKKSQRKEPKRQGKGKLALSAEEWRVQIGPHSASRTYSDIF